MNNARTFLLLTRKYPFPDLDSALQKNVHLFVRNMFIRQAVIRQMRPITHSLYQDIEDHADTPYSLSNTRETHEVYEHIHTVFLKDQNP